MKYCDSISWIGGEGIQSRYHIGQGEENKRQLQVGFSWHKIEESIVSYGSFHIVIFYMYVGGNGDNWICVIMTKGMVHLKMFVVQGLYNEKYYAIFVCSCISLSGPLSMLKEP
jgi:hypothetical protein